MDTNKIPSRTFLIGCILLIVIGANLIIYLKCSGPKDHGEYYYHIDHDKELDRSPRLPTGEHLYDKNDKQAYKALFRPIHQKEGIKTGVFIYYGRYIKPPYKVEVSYIDKDCKILVNGLNVSDGEKKINRRIQEARFLKKGKKVEISEEERKRRIESEKDEDRIVKYLKSYIELLGKNYDLSKKSQQEEMFKEIELFLAEYMKSKPRVLNYEVASLTEITVELKAYNYDWGMCYDISPYITTDPENDLFIMPKDTCYYEAENWEKRLKSEYVQMYNIGHSQIEPEKLIQIAKIIKSNDSSEQKIKNIYSITLDLDSAKSLFYNLETSEVLSRLNSKEKIKP